MVDGTLARRFGGCGDRSVNDDVAVCAVVDVDRACTEYTHLTGMSCVRDDLSKVRRRKHVVVGLHKVVRENEQRTTTRRDALYIILILMQCDERDEGANTQ